MLTTNNLRNCCLRKPALQMEVNLIMATVGIQTERCRTTQVHGLDVKQEL